MLVTAWAVWDLSLIRVENALVLALLGAVAILVRAYRRSQAASRVLTETKLRQDATLDVVADAIITITQHGTIIATNSAAQRLLGYSRSELVGQDVTRLMPPQQAANHPQYMANYLRTGERRIIGIGRELLARHADGRDIPIELNVREVRLPDRRLFVGLLRDLRERDELSHSQQLLSAIVAGSHDAIIGLDLAGTITSWNEAAQQLYGYTAAEAVGRSVSILLPSGRGDEPANYLTSIAAGHAVQPFESVRRRKNGERIIVAIRVSPIRDRHGAIVGVSTVAHDLTARKAAEDRFQVLFECSADAHTIYNRDGILHCNAAAAKLLAGTAAEILGRHPLTLSPETQPGTLRSADGWRLCERAARKYGVHRCEWVLRTLDGREVPAEVTLTPIHYQSDSAFLLVLHDLTAHKSAEEELRRANRALLSSLENEREATLRLEATLHELAVATATAESASAAKSQFLAKMSHEIRTPLAVILGYLDLVRQQVPTGSEVSEWCTVAAANGESLRQLLSDLLDVARIEAGMLEIRLAETNIAELLRLHEQDAAARAAAANINFRIEAIGDIPHTFTAAPLRIHQVLSNLLANALKYTKHGEVVLRVRSLDPPAPSVRLEFSVADTGCGIADVDLPTIFEPFIQADDELARSTNGVGLGLSIVRRLVDLMNGTVDVESVAGVGSTFRVALPVTDAENWGPVERLTALPMPPAPPRPRLTGRVLICDDAPDLRRLCARKLAGWGLDCDAAEDGHEAVERIAANQYDVILMDWRMPRMDGLAATRALRERGCKIPIIAVTAHAMVGDRETCLSAGCSAYVTKPINFSQLRTIIRPFLTETPGDLPAGVAPLTTASPAGPVACGRSA